MEKMIEGAVLWADLDLLGACRSVMISVMSCLSVISHQRSSHVMSGLPLLGPRARFGACAIRYALSNCTQLSHSPICHSAVCSV
eukprot:SAG25_NODE_62_length_17948_cov_8.453975_12_plen_84_part_00